MKTDLKYVFDQFPNRQREDLIPVLQKIQDIHGFLSEDIIREVSDFLKISVNKIYGVATFYDNFRFGPRGRFHIRLCQGSACHVAGASTILNELEKLLRIRNGETDKQGLFSLEVVSCIGACGLAPLIEINQDYHTRLTLESMKEIIRQCRENDQTEYDSQGGI